MTSWPAARQAARDAAKPLEAVEVPLADALGATLAEPLTAHTPVPAFDTSAMDGYAVAGEGPWTLVGHVLAGGRTLPASTWLTAGDGLAGDGGAGGGVGAAGRGVGAAGGGAGGGGDGGGGGGGGGGDVVAGSGVTIGGVGGGGGGVGAAGGGAVSGGVASSGVAGGTRADRRSAAPSWAADAQQGDRSDSPDTPRVRATASRDWHTPDNVTAGQAAGAPVPRNADATPIHHATHTRQEPAAGGPTGAPLPRDASEQSTSPTTSALTAGQAVGIATGAPVPRGADAVLPMEHAARIGMTVVGGVQVGRHIRRAGEDCGQGRELLPSGVVVSPAVLGLAAAVGHDVLRVHRRPRVAVVLTGDEVVRAGRPGVGQVRDAIGPVLPGVLAAAGAELVDVVHVPDLAAPLVEALRRDDVDVVVVGGATSKGPADHLRAVLAELGADVRVAGVECRPGHPQLLAVLPGGTCVVGLPGNPFAALGACLTLVAPLVGALAGRAVAPVVTAELCAEVRAHPRDTRLVPVVLTGSAAFPVGHDRPGTLWGAALADALAVVPPRWAGGPVELLYLSG